MGFFIQRVEGWGAATGACFAEFGCTYCEPRPFASLGKKKPLTPQIELIERSGVPRSRPGLRRQNPLAFVPDGVSRRWGSGDALRWRRRSACVGVMAGNHTQAAFLPAEITFRTCRSIQA
jgi:hypothetical protein